MRVQWVVLIGLRRRGRRPSDLWAFRKEDRIQTGIPVAPVLYLRRVLVNRTASYRETRAISRAVLDAVKKLTPLPIRLVINTEVHPDHTRGLFVFSPPALVINHAGASEAMRKAENPDQLKQLKVHGAVATR